METRTQRRRTVNSHLVSSGSSTSSSASVSESTKHVKGSEDSDVLEAPRKIPLPGLLATVDTPLQTRGLEKIRQKIEKELSKEKSAVSKFENVSPGLSRLRNTPGHGLKERQRELIQKHNQIRQNSDKLNVGGGVTLWPNLNRMRLTSMEIFVLIFTCIVLMTITGFGFYFLHGETFYRMQRLREHLENFQFSHQLLKKDAAMRQHLSIIGWHIDFKILLEGVDKNLNVKMPSAGYQLYVAAYLVAFSILLYFLVDNMLSKSKLSPGRIKKWVCLLVIVGQWTVMLFIMFIFAHKVETAIINNVYWISEKLGEFVERDDDLTTLTGVVQYWRWRCLPPSAPGIVHILGLMSIQDATVYLQYYSLPILTVLLTPVVRLCLALRTVYVPGGSQ